MREFHVDFIRSMPRHAISHGTAADFGPCSVPPNAVAVLTQMTCPNHVSPKSANQESFFSFFFLAGVRPQCSDGSDRKTGTDKTWTDKIWTDKIWTELNHPTELGSRKLKLPRDGSGMDSGQATEQGRVGGHQGRGTAMTFRVSHLLFFPLPLHQYFKTGGHNDRPGSDAMRGLKDHLCSWRLSADTGANARRRKVIGGRIYVTRSIMRPTVSAQLFRET